MRYYYGLQYVDYAGLTRQHELVHTDHTDDVSSLKELDHRVEIDVSGVWICP